MPFVFREKIFKHLKIMATSYQDSSDNRKNHNHFRYFRKAFREVHNHFRYFQKAFRKVRNHFRKFKKKTIICSLGIFIYNYYSSIYLLSRLYLQN
jgi:hypothetical protein